MTNALPRRRPIRRRPGTSPIDERLDALLAGRDLDDLGPTLRALEELDSQHPGVPEVLYELACAHALNGDLPTARLRYQDALAAGPVGELLRRCLLRYSSVLHALGEADEAAQIIAEVRRRFPGAPSQKVFDAISLHTSGEVEEAFSTLLEVVTEAYGANEEDRFHAGFLRALAVRG
ncbi:tetratricopeptide repeat protein [Demequina salsinemoris]|uniref:tetratricopeptide repeat protein n=1 Tax=Demequina salsinemoris TaxID=577470 RepID=UPI00078498F5|nr:tetratricopeptide repeat protein [Demequina salsinemoris]